MDYHQTRQWEQDKTVPWWYVTEIYEAINSQVELWEQTDSCYQKAVISGDSEKMLGLENFFISMAREAVFECMVYIWLFSAVPSGAAVLYF